MNRYRQYTRWVATEWLNDELVGYHVIRAPRMCIKEGYPAAVSFNAFRRREGERHFKDGRPRRRRPAKRYSLEQASPYLMNARFRRAIERLLAIKRARAPITRHGSLWDFYAAIGYDHKRNRYL